MINLIIRDFRRLFYKVKNILTPPREIEPIRPITFNYGNYYNFEAQVPTPGFAAKFYSDVELVDIDNIKEYIKNCFIDLSDLNLVYNISFIGDYFNIEVDYFRFSGGDFEKFSNYVRYTDNVINEMVLESILKLKVEYPNINPIIDIRSRIRIYFSYKEVNNK